jgi:hypothetical protein
MINARNFAVSFAASTMILLMALPSLAGERAFRIDRHNVTANGYAIAWGVKGQLVDFEKIEQAGSDAVATWIAENSEKMENYIVDVETNSIISIISGANEPSTSGDLGGVHIGNHFSYALADLSVNGLKYDGAGEVEAVGLISSFKWWTNLSSVSIIRRNAGKVEVISTTLDLDGKIIEQVRVKLPTATREKFDEMSCHISFGKAVSASGKPDLMAYTLDCAVPKSEDSMNVTGQLAFKLVGNKVVAKVISAKAK